MKYLKIRLQTTTYRPTNHGHRIVNNELLLWYSDKTKQSKVNSILVIPDEENKLFQHYPLSQSMQSIVYQWSHDDGTWNCTKEVNVRLKAKGVRLLVNWDAPRKAKLN